MLDIEGCIEGAACPSDYIRVHDGEDETSPILLTQYGQDKITLHSTSNQAHLLFNSDLAVQYVGFKAQLTEANIGKINYTKIIEYCYNRRRVALVRLLLVAISTWLITDQMYEAKTPEKGCQR